MEKFDSKHQFAEPFASHLKAIDLPTLKRFFCHSRIGEAA